MAVLGAEPAEQGDGAAEDGECGDLLPLEGVHATDPGDGVRIATRAAVCCNKPARRGVWIYENHPAAAERVRQLAGPTREEDIMKGPRRAVIVVTAAIAALGPAATAAGAVASVSRGGTPARAAAGHVRVTATIGVGRFPVGVAVNPRTDTIYVANANSGTMSVISGRTSTVTATVGVGGRFPAGVAANPRTNTIYITRAGKIVTHGIVSVISGRTNAVTATVRVGRAANGVATNPTTKRIYVTNAASKTVSVISARNNMVVATVRVGYPAAFGVAANPRTNTIYVANGDDQTVVISGRTNTVAARVRTGNCSVGVATDPRTSTTFVTNACSNTVSVLVSCRGRAGSRSMARCRRDDPQAGTTPGSIASLRS